MVQPEEKIEVDYAKSKEELFWQVIDVVVPGMQDRIQTDELVVSEEISLFDRLIESLCRGLKLAWPPGFSVRQFWTEKLKEIGRAFTNEETALLFLVEKRRDKWEVISKDGEVTYRWPPFVEIAFFRQFTDQNEVKSMDQANSRTGANTALV
ncbi:hypothetical protein EJ08DRAFT_699968 [Tothia fuscella]|uniref:Uncharacterized protein n=1 Tax=Tothia fuscella TaxID=1048955 RepID=A0A9P4TW10_9PEZI|nr:hypothetical protein EJ08DRAFT_699968 [Tothia fuscella]